MNRPNKLQHFAFFPALLAFIALCLGAWAPSAHAQREQVKKSRTHTSSSKVVHIRKASKRSRRRYSRRYRGQKAPTKDRISEIQAALAKDGEYTGEPTGKWDNSTIEAMRKFQAEHGLNPSGKIDALSLEKLGLGSETAGIAAPLPPINSTSADPVTPPQSAERQ